MGQHWIHDTEDQYAARVARYRADYRAWAERLHTRRADWGMMVQLVSWLAIPLSPLAIGMAHELGGLSVNASTAVGVGLLLLALPGYGLGLRMSAAWEAEDPKPQL